MTKARQTMQDKRQTNGFHGGDLWKGLAAGLVGGLVASWTMNRFQAVWSKLAEGIEKSPDTQLSKPEVQDDTTVRAVSAVSEGLFDHKLTQSEKEIAGPAVHYILGTSVGGLMARQPN